MITRYTFSLIIFLLTISVCRALNVDSLLKEVKTANDTQQVKVLNRIAQFYQSKSIQDSALFFAKKSYQLAKKANKPYLLGEVYRTYGIIYYKLGDLEKNLQYRKLSLEERIKTNDTSLIGNAWIDVGHAYAALEQFTSALQAHLTALELFTAINKIERIAACNINIGNVYAFRKDLKESIKYYLIAENLIDTALHKEIQYTLYNNIGAIYSELKDYKNAKVYIAKSLKLRLATNNPEEISTGYGNLGSVLSSLKEFDSALVYIQKSLEMNRAINNNYGVALNLLNMSVVYMEQNKHAISLPLLLEGVALADAYNISEYRDAFYKRLVTVYKQKGDFKSALFYAEKYIQLNDSLNREHTDRSLTEYRNKLESAQKQKEIDDLEHQKLTQEVIISQQKHLRNVLLLGAFLLIILLWLIFSRYKSNKKTTRLLAFHNQEMELKNREITDSITYAKRIQQAYMPSEDLFYKIFNDSFLLYHPKDIVSGDFYWFYSPEKKKIFLAVADCTGHGVPGALMSVICSNALNDATVINRIYNPAEVLNAARSSVKTNLKSSNYGQKDGMDISLCFLDYSEYNNNQIVKINWAGANNGLWIVNPNRQKWPENVKPFAPDMPGSAELKPDKQPIGFHEKETPFTNHSIELEKGDTVYLFTDGFADQFGGEKSKKYKPANLKKFLYMHYHKSMEEQKVILKEEFENWKGNIEQTDDVCIIGIRI